MCHICNKQNFLISHNIKHQFDMETETESEIKDKIRELLAQFYQQYENYNEEEYDLEQHVHYKDDDNLSEWDKLTFQIQHKKIAECEIYKANSAKFVRYFNDIMDEFRDPEDLDETQEEL